MRFKSVVSSLEYCQFQIAAHNKHKHLLQRDTTLVIILTFVVLLLGAFLANTCVQILRHHGYIYTTSSFGKHIRFLLPRAIGIVARHIIPSSYHSRMISQRGYQGIHL